MWKAIVLDKHGKEHVFTHRNREQVEAWVQDGVNRSLWGQNKRFKTVSSLAPGMVALKQETRLNSKNEPITLYEVMVEAEFTISIAETSNTEDLRKERNRILKNSDWLFISDVPVPSKFRIYYREYRQHLRDLLNTKATKIEYIEHWLRRVHPEEFMDGGKADKIIELFNSYLKED